MLSPIEFFTEEEKQIEEMYQEFRQYKEDTMCSVFSYRGMCKNFIDLGYCKIDKDSVALSMEELKEKYVSKSFYELAKKVHEEKVEELENLIRYWIENWKQARKEATSEVITKIKQLLNTVDIIRDNDTYNLQPDMGYNVREVDDLLDELAKQCDVEIKE